MKNIIIAMFVLALILTGSSINAQSSKIGHINMQILIAAMPESDSAQAFIQRTTKELQATYQQMQTELNKKYEEYNKSSKSLNELVKATKEGELNDMSKRVQEFQTSAQQQLQDLNQKLLKPILEKANKAISDIAREGKFTYILDTPTQGGTVVFIGTDAIDIMPLVKKKLGLTK
jgi:outer membrane protein